MAKTANLIVFTCQGCSHSVDTDELRENSLLPWKRKLKIEPDGTCKKCGGTLWTLSLVFVEAGYDTLESSIGFGMAMTTGIGFSQASSAASQFDYHDIAAIVVANLIASPKGRAQRISNYANLLEREKQLQQGAIECRGCGILFTNNSSNSWHRFECCSRHCAIKHGVEIDSVDDLRAAGESSEIIDKDSASNINWIQCPKGHSFAVAKSFAGLLRPCPACGTKTQVPNLKE